MTSSAASVGETLSVLALSPVSAFAFLELVDVFIVLVVVVVVVDVLVVDARLLLLLLPSVPGSLVAPRSGKGPGVRRACRTLSSFVS